VVRAVFCTRDNSNRPVASVVQIIELTQGPGVVSVVLEACPEAAGVRGRGSMK
jgi:hypothetical protein